MTLLKLCDLPDTLGGMRKATKLLKLDDESDPKQREALPKQYYRGWFADSREAKKHLAKSNPNVDLKGVDLKELNALNWERIVKVELTRLDITENRIPTNPKGAEWEFQTTKRLQIGHPNDVSNRFNKN